jgi:hypothetical protein
MLADQTAGTKTCEHKKKAQLFGAKLQYGPGLTLMPGLPAHLTLYLSNNPIRRGIAVTSHRPPPNVHAVFRTLISKT